MKRFLIAVLLIHFPVSAMDFVPGLAQSRVHVQKSRTVLSAGTIAAMRALQAAIKMSNSSLILELSNKLNEPAFKFSSNIEHALWTYRLIEKGGNIRRGVRQLLATILASKSLVIALLTTDLGGNFEWMLLIEGMAKL